MSKLEVDAIEPQSGTTLTIGASGDTTNIVGTLQNDGSAVTSYSDSDALSLFNASGSAPVYAPRAWVNFDATGTPSIRDSGNVSSITDHGTGDFSMNFTTALEDNDYAVSGSIGNDGPTTNTTAFNLNGSLATGSFRVHTASNGSSGSAYNDFAVNTFMVMR